MSEDNWAKKDQGFADYLKANPGGTFAEFHHLKHVEKVKQGAVHPTLGPNLANGEDFWSHGAERYAAYMARFAVAPNERVVEYGCGSLRVGAHFIRDLDPGNFVGLDVTEGWIDMGKALIGDDLLAEKQPRFGPIDETHVAMAAEFDPTFVFASAVAFHVHPDEQAPFFENLIRIAHVPGARLVFDAKIADRPLRYANTGWAWPVEHYTAALAGFDLFDQVDQRDREKDGVDGKYRSSLLAFRKR